MKAIFLDIDGCICLRSSRYKNFDITCSNNLKKIVDETGSVIVISSCWRHGFIDWERSGKNGGGLLS